MDDEVDDAAAETRKGISLGDQSSTGEEFESLGNGGLGGGAPVGGGLAGRVAHGERMGQASPSSEDDPDSYLETSLDVEFLGLFSA